MISGQKHPGGDLLGQNWRMQRSRQPCGRKFVLRDGPCFSMPRNLSQTGS